MTNPTNRRQFLQSSTAAVGATILSSSKDNPMTPNSFFNVLDFGAKPDNSTDNTAAFQKALDHARDNHGGIIFAPAGRYLFTGSLSIPSSVTLEGTFRSVPAHNGIRDKGLPKPGDDGTTLLPTANKNSESAAPFLSLTTNSCLKGLVIYYPEQDQTKIPQPYPWTIALRGKNPAVLDVELLNPYNAIDASDNERHLIRNVHGQPLRRGILVDQIYDIGRIENVHFNPWWSMSDAVTKFMADQGEAFIIGKTDWQYMLNCFSIFHRVGFRFTQFKHGPGNAVLTQCGHDIAPTCVKVEHTQPHAGVAFVNSQFMGSIEVNESNQGPVKFTNCGFWGVGPGNINNLLSDVQADLAGAGHITFNACHFTAWDQRHQNHPSIRARCSGLTLTACDFLDPKNHLELSPNVKSAIVLANRFRGGAKITNNAPSAQIGFNTET